MAHDQDSHPPGEQTTGLPSQERQEAPDGAAGALTTDADALLAELSSADQELCRRVFLRLVTLERTRAVVSMNELRALARDSDAVEQVVLRLARAQLVLIEPFGRPEGATVELAHESLIAGWATLQRWLDERARAAQFVDRLRAAAEQWQAGDEAEALVFRDREAKEALGWLADRRPEEEMGSLLELGRREEQYLLSVAALAERAQRRKRRIAAGIFTALAAITIVTSSLAIREHREAARATREAALSQTEGARARNTTRMAKARELLQKNDKTDPTTAFALLREVEPPTVPEGWAELTLVALRSGVSGVVLSHPDRVRSAAWSPDGQRIVTTSLDKTCSVWNADGTGEPVVLRGHASTIYSAVFDPDGKRIVTASSDRTARVWNADGTGEPLVLRGHDGGILSAAFSADGKRIITASQDRAARVYSADGTGEPLVLRGHEGWVVSAALSADGKRIVTASLDKTVRVWSADGTGEPLVLRGHEGAIAAAAFSPDGKRIVTASADKTVRVWNTDGTGEPLVLRGHEGWVDSAAFSPDGQRIVTASLDKTVRIWSADGTGEPVVLRGHDKRVYTAAFSPDGQRIVTASEDKTARIWADAAPLRGTDDPRQWTAIPSCMSIERRIELLNVSDATARADQDACQRRVAAARATDSKPR